MLVDNFLDIIFAFHLGRKHLYPNDCIFLSDQVDEGKNNEISNSNYNQLDVYTYRKTERNDLTKSIIDNSLSIKIAVISDTHTRHDKIGSLPKADILIHCGDILMVNRKYSKKNGIKKIKKFNDWLGTLEQFKCKIVIAGNHDKIFEDLTYEEIKKLISNANYLMNQKFELFGLKFFATPLSEESTHGNSANIAFQSEEFKEKVYDIAKDAGEIDILISHGQCSELQSLCKPKLHLWGHHHSLHGIKLTNVNTLSICASIMDEYYQLKNMPIYLNLSLPLQTPKYDSKNCNFTSNNLVEAKQSKKNTLHEIIRKYIRKLNVNNVAELICSRKKYSIHPEN